MEAMNITQIELSRITKKDKTTINRWFHGSRGISLETLDLLSNALNIKPTDLINPNLKITVKIDKRIIIKN